MASEQVLWGIHAGRTGDANRLFLEHDCIAIGWGKMGDLCALEASREAFKKCIADVYPSSKAGSIPVNAGQVFRFVHEIADDDLVIYPSKTDREIHIGKVVGPYRYDPKSEPGYPNQRPVQWLNSFPRTRFSQGALYEIGSSLSLFQVKNYADEFLAALGGEPAVVGAEEDSTVALVAEEVEATTKDFVLKRLATELKGHPFADFVAHLMQAMGYRTRVSPEGPDGGIDIVAHKDELGFEPPIIKVQVKSSEGSVGDPVVSALYGKVSEGEFGLLVTLGTVTNQARGFARNKSNLRLIDGDDLVSLVLQHYAHLDSKYKGLIPMKRVYIPELIEESEEA